VLEDARRIPNGTRVEADICVVGTGPAGLSLALGLMGSGRRVCLLEAGGKRPDRVTQSLLDGEASFYPGDMLRESRIACLGGTSRVWSGWCRPVDAEDLEPRSWVDEDGWPFGREELDAYYARAQVLCGLGVFDYEAERWHSEGCAPLPLPSDLVETQLFQLSPPTRFGREYRRAVQDARDVRVLLHAPCTELVPDAAGRRIAVLRAATLGGGVFDVKARAYVLAAGGIENPRLLLLSDRVRPGGLGTANSSGSDGVTTARPSREPRGGGTLAGARCARSSLATMGLPAAR
jgi:choline dehydrogenase-like flavoprotein